MALLELLLVAAGTGIVSSNLFCQGKYSRDFCCSKMADGINAKALDEQATASNPNLNASVLDLDTNPTLIDVDLTGF